ncbi:LacI family DNA-binding transcriptional regulator [Homoserinibacter sp. YIM 151385]|uniref:LacI family DNA-binding transcriptional regulator n=1 Tax=Homoserinibacter sp. YIM 151385 TaxID=2985506 RepID=UPI0022F0BF12|nr:LacI family DNA-binding transcriptional regulator [Homoserinibacter sp. YIM 151385]WBU37123.1 LacI family DNA-binding transcriptional regulator [Homoserinibacter sp. YIM 151385]
MIPTAGAGAPTLEQVAAAAGVSRSTVSRVVNGSPKVSPDVMRAVQLAIEQLDYTPNRAARSLAARRTMAIALVVPEATARFFGDPYFAAIVQGITRELEASDYVLNLQLASPESPSDKTVRYLLGGNVDGALVVSHHTGDGFLASLGERMPVVFGGRPLDPATDSGCWVDVDNAAAAASGVAYLVERGHRRIATIAGPADMPAGIDRLEGWRRALRAADLRDDLVAQGDFTLPGGARAMRELLAREAEIDAVFVASDLMAVGALGAIRERGLRVPQDLAVLGFDDSPAALSGEIAITTVRQPSVEMGAEMARTLLRMLAGEDVPRSRIMPTEVVVRESA